MEEDDDILIFLTKSEYAYVSECLNTLYNNLSKLPKKMRTPKFYILEGIVHNKFFI